MFTNALKYVLHPIIPWCSEDVIRTNEKTNESNEMETLINSGKILFILEINMLFTWMTLKQVLVTCSYYNETIILRIIYVWNDTFKETAQNWTVKSAANYNQHFICCNIF